MEVFELRPELIAGIMVIIIMIKVIIIMNKVIIAIKVMVIVVIMIIIIVSSPDPRLPAPEALPLSATLLPLSLKPHTALHCNALTCTT